MLLGRVKWFDDNKGYGFITPLDQNEKAKGDVFIHHENISKYGYKTVEKNQLVRYEPSETVNGLLASFIEPLEINAQEAMDKVTMNLLKGKFLNIVNDLDKEVEMFVYSLLQLHIVDVMQGEDGELSDFIYRNKDQESMLDLLENKKYSYKSKRSLQDYIKHIADNNIVHSEVVKNII